MVSEVNKSHAGQTWGYRKENQVGHTHKGSLEINIVKKKYKQRQRFRLSQ